MGFYVYRKFYFSQAENKWRALDLLREAEEKGIVNEFFVSQWARDEKDVSNGGWFNEIKKQLSGK